MLILATIQTAKIRVNKEVIIAKTTPAAYSNAISKDSTEPKPARTISAERSVAK